MKKLFLTLALLLLPLNVFAHQKGDWQIGIGTNTGFVRIDSGGQAASVFVLDLSLERMITDWLQVGVSTNLAFADEVDFEALAGVFKLRLPVDSRISPYFLAAPGFVNGNNDFTGASETAFQITTGVGIDVGLVEHVALTVEALYSNAFLDQGVEIFTVRPRLSFFF